MYFPTRVFSLCNPLFWEQARPGDLLKVGDFTTQVISSSSVGEVPVQWLPDDEAEEISRPFVATYYGERDGILRPETPPPPPPPQEEVRMRQPPNQKRLHREAKRRTRPVQVTRPRPVRYFLRTRRAPTPTERPRTRAFVRRIVRAAEELRQHGELNLATGILMIAGLQ